MRQTTSTVSATLDVPLPDALFERPTTWPSTLRRPADADRLPLPALVGPNGQVAVTLRLPGHTNPIVCLLDSGAAGSVLYPHAVAHLSLATVSAGRVQGVGTNHPLVTEANIPEARVGALTLVNRIWAVNDAGLGFDGILGYDFFRGHVLVLSYRDRTLVSVRPDRYVPPAGAIELPLSLAHNLPSVGVTLNGIHATLAVDLGFNGEVALFRPFVTTQGWREQEGDTAQGAGGEEQTGLVTLTQVRLGGTTFPQVNALVVRGGGFADGLLGAGLFTRLAEIHFDYERHRLWFVPKPWLGARFRAQTLTIVSPLPGSPAEIADLRAGDRLLSLDGAPLTTYGQFVQLLMTRAVGETITLTLQRGRDTLTRTVTLAPSFQ